jgi:hypothetical protein
MSSFINYKINNVIMKKELPQKQREELLSTLKERFEKNPARHKGISWAKVEAKLKSKPSKLWSLNEMEKTGGEPDVTGFDKESGKFVFTDCSKETPKDRRSICYDKKALEERKKFKPKNSAVEMASEMGIELLTEQQYRELQNSESLMKKPPAGFKPRPE